MALHNAPSLAQENEWLIPAETATCIRDNADCYASLGTDPVVIIVAACPETDMAKALSKTATNTGTTTVAPGDSVLILSKAELACLVTLDLVTDADGLVRIPKSLRCD